MAKPPVKMGQIPKFALPLHVQRLEKSLELPRFLNYAEKVLNETSDDEVSEGNLTTTRDERRSDRSRLFNAEHVGGEREELRNVLISETSDESVDGDDPITEQHFQNMLRQHVFEKKLRQKFYSKASNMRFQYYGSGLLSNYDKYSGHNLSKLSENSVSKSSIRRVSAETKEPVKMKKFRRPVRREQSDFDDSDENTREEDDDLANRMKPGRGRPKKTPETTVSPEVMAARRRKIFSMIAKKEVGKSQRARMNTHKEVVQMMKKVAQMCTKHWKQNALQSQKNMKETVWRNKRLAREMQAYWKRYERVERDARRRQEKEAEEQRKMDLEFMEAKRQQRKLNFLITQTELYAHFISKKFGGSVSGDKDSILKQLEDDVAPRLSAYDDYDSEQMKSKAESIVTKAVNAEEERTRLFNVNSESASFPSEAGPDEKPQPKMFKGTLKHYQLKGMNWLANLYDQGINGILADEMGLGKTVQSLAFLCHIAETYGVWGPFLIISPASTLHNWQQEIERFVPDFKVVPYWGNVHERKILRHFWDTKRLHTKDASFHIVVTSYQLIISDFKYFNRIKWQYLILDEAQAIKSSNSQRWKLLLGFSCRNRLLLSGTPIQNSMAELWALLHFIMPTLFDNHEEFSEWFSKDIEGQAENKTRIDEKHLSRLHLILKPFMLRRIKKDVENELSDKIEIMMYCPLTTRQRLLYAGLKQKIRVEDLLAGLSGRTGPGDDPARGITSNLMNIVMQFRKVCNHPELFERREAWSPFCLPAPEYVIPKLVFEYGLLWRNIPSQRHITHNWFSVFAVENIHKTLFRCFSFLRLIGLSSQEAQNIFTGGILAFWLSIQQERQKADIAQHSAFWGGVDKLDNLLLVRTKSWLEPPHSRRSSVLRDILFTRMVGPRSRVYTHTRRVHCSMPETLQHRVLRSQKVRVKTTEETPDLATAEDNTKLKSLKNQSEGSQTADEVFQEFLVPEFPFTPRPPKVYECVPTSLPEFLLGPFIKVQGRSREMYASCRNNTWERLRHNWCSTPEGFETVWYGHPNIADNYRKRNYYFGYSSVGGLLAVDPPYGWSNIIIPDKQTLVADAGKLYVLDGLLKRLKEGGHRVLIYSQMTRMIDLLEEYMWHRKHTYMRLDGSSKISERRDMVADFQSRADIFVFLLSTRAGGLGINLTAADTVIFYDSDWNPTVDQQAMDRAHRLGQTKQVTVYRLICKGTIEERMLQRAREKSEIQRMVISGGDFKPDQLKTKEVVSLLLDDDEMMKKYQQKQAERKMMEDGKWNDKSDGSEKGPNSGNPVPSFSNIKQETADDPDYPSSMSTTPSTSSRQPCDGSDEFLDVDGSPFQGYNSGSSPIYPLGIGSVRVRPTVRGSKRGRPRGTGRGGSNALRRRTHDSDIKLPGELFLTGESPSSSLESSSTKRAREAVELPPGVRRGPGRPRMKPIGPAMQGTRGPRGRGRRPRARKAPQPLQVPLGLTPPTVSPGTSHGFFPQHNE